MAVVMPTVTHGIGCASLLLFDLPKAISLTDGNLAS